MEREQHLNALIRILQCAYSGELAAGHAYRGHWRSVKKQQERAAIQRIELEEWVHRKRVGEMLTELGAMPLPRKEIRMWLVGHTIGASCHLIGWFFPMYFAGRLESGNVVEYEEAARHAAALGFTAFEKDLVGMARVEREHEIFFLNVIAGHRLLPLTRRLFKWGCAEPRDPTVSRDEFLTESAD
jgi:demethoxyubiquinone hydroxylase (CLK1/Coq7/Cat5 family)